MASWYTILLTGGTVGAAGHLMYLPIILAAAGWKTFGGAMTGLTAGIAVALLPAHTHLGDQQMWTAAVIRTVAYVSVGSVVGLWSARLDLRHRQVTDMTLQSIAALINTVEAKDPFTSGHSIRVASIAHAIGQEMLLDERTLFVLHTGGLLHDIGKVAVPEEVLRKPGRLTPAERAIMQRHPLEGNRILAPFDHRDSKRIRDIVLHHHERLDGSGYPHQLRSGEITQLARVVAVADVYEALTSNRTYRPGIDRVSALLVLQQEAEAGRLDGAVVGFLRSLVLTNRLSVPLEGYAPRPTATPMVL